MAFHVVSLDNDHYTEIPVCTFDSLEEATTWMCERGLNCSDVELFEGEHLDDGVWRPMLQEKQNVKKAERDADAQAKKLEREHAEWLRLKAKFEGGQ